MTTYEKFINQCFLTLLGGWFLVFFGAGADLFGINFFGYGRQVTGDAFVSRAVSYCTYKGISKETGRARSSLVECGDPFEIKIAAADGLNETKNKFEEVVLTYRDDKNLESTLRLAPSQIVGHDYRVGDKVTVRARSGNPKITPSLQLATWSNNPALEFILANTITTILLALFAYLRRNFRSYKAF